MKLGLLVPRYGTEVVGGTEHWLRTLCEHLVALKGWQVEVFTTCATSAATWRDELAAGSQVVNGVTVHRHPSRSGRNPRYLDMLPQLRLDPGAMAVADVERYVRLVGPVCPDAIGDAEASDCDLVAVTPYLYWPAVHGVPRLGRRVLFHGAAHDEPELHLPVMREVFGAVGGFSFNSFAERQLVESLFPVAHLPAAVIGNAVLEGDGDAAAARTAVGIEPDEPFVLCVSRIERSKGTHLLADLWALYRSRRPEAPRLVLLGPVHEAIEERPGVVIAGRQSEEVKWGALRSCSVLVVPSAWESFSLVAIEGWLAGRPVLVNARCGPTVEHCTRSAGGLWFDQYADFEAALDVLLSDVDLCNRLAANGADYARSQFSWPVVTDRYEQLCRRVLEASPARWPAAAGHR